MSWFVFVADWLEHYLPYMQISLDTGWAYVQAENMSGMQQEIHDRLEAWILKDKKK